MKKSIILLTILLAIICSCAPNLEEFSDTDPNIIDDSEGILANLNIPSNFNYETTQDIEVNIGVSGLTDLPLAGVKVSFHTRHPDDGGKHLSSVFTDINGQLDVKVQIPSYYEEIFVQVHSAGFANQKAFPVAPQIQHNFGGAPEARSTNSSKSSSTPTHISGNYYYMGTFSNGSSGGLPDYLEAQGDNLSQEFLDGVDASLPETKPVPVFNPGYLNTGNELDVVVVDPSEVWVTFITEGAGYKNALGYYVFDTNSPPSNASEIDSIFVILPNASLQGSGGKLNAGDKIKLGLFESGKTISWVLFQSAWTGSGVNVNQTKFYSRTDLNITESDPTKRQHTVQLADYGRQHLMNGFEDQTRSVGSDNDFNDLVFYVTANPWTAIDIDEIPPVTPSDDDDGDGISNEIDDFPTDPTRAIRNTYIGALAYEDLWPSKGDYDFNDLVIDYEVDHILNGNNLLVDIEADWTIKAVFAGYKNGFGIHFENLDPTEIASVSGTNMSENIITQNANGTEANQDDATVIIFDNVFTAVQSSGSLFPHTSPTTTISSTINMSNPISQNSTGLPPYNAFIFANGNRDTEVHLPGKKPTDLASPLLFGTLADATDTTSDYFYKTTNGLPWAIHISEPFDFPNESTPINQAYLFFTTWTTSGGNSNADWYLNLPGYRDSSKIYD